MSHNIEDIIPPSKRQSFRERPRDVAEKTSEFLSEKRKETSKNKSPKRKFAYTPAIIAIGVIIISVGALLFFSGAQVEIIPNAHSAQLSTTLTATASSTSVLPFSLITIDKRATQYVPVLNTKTVTSVAQGMLTIYNTLHISQHLIIKTRFKTLKGIVFLLKKPVTIPAGHGAVPGAINVSVYATAPGSEYNIQPSFFTVPGLANTSLANKIYAKSKSSMKGGASGVVPIISNKKEIQTRIALKKALVESLHKAIIPKVPSDYTFFSNAAATTYTELPNVLATSTKSVGVQESAQITMVVFPSLALAKNIASEVFPTYSGVAPVFIQNSQKLIFTPLGTFPNAKTQLFRFSLSGNVTIVWLVDKTRIATAIAGKSHKEAQNILSAFPSIGKAYLVLRPFWLSTFPKDPSKIKITVSRPQ